MNDPITQLIILGAISVFLILKLRSVLGTRTGFEPTVIEGGAAGPARRDDTDAHLDITDHVELDSAAGQALLAMKDAEPSFNLDEFMNGARQAYGLFKPRRIGALVQSSCICRWLAHNWNDDHSLFGRSLF